ncbi:unnamed protein product [Fusarium equiseti]|uniref:Uncharacterized protein n=1 Tax=Fusarium equiseti TaxID=61235 RepID=A0A8J2N742_FUSEQ|nr:unnamed protein product [Fusarium equiseti]
MPSPRTNLGPLTTQWKYPDRCTAAVIGCSTCDAAWQAQTCGDDNANAVSPHKSLEAALIRLCSKVGYECAGPGGRQTCTSVASIGSLQVASCSTSETVLNWLTLPATFTEETSTVTLEGLTVYAPMFQLNWREKDLPLSTTLSSETGSTGSPGPSTATDTATSESSKNSSSSGGLSTGAQAGIGVGVAVVGLAIIAAALYLWRRIRARVPATSELAGNEPKAPGQMAGTPVSPPPQYHPAELDASHHRHEI